MGESFSKSTNSTEGNERLSKRILLAEDLRPLREVVLKFLAREGYKVDEVEDGQQLLDKLIEEKYDLIITDNNMPRLTGFEALEKIYNDERFNKIPRILYSATLDEKIIEDVKKLGGVCVEKGTPMNILLNKVKEMLSESKE